MVSGFQPLQVLKQYFDAVLHPGAEHPGSSNGPPYFFGRFIQAAAWDGEDGEQEDLGEAQGPCSEHLIFRKPGRKENDNEIEKGTERESKRKIQIARREREKERKRDKAKETEKWK